MNGIAAALAAAFNGAVKRLKLTPPPKTLSYLETSLVSYQDTPSGGTKKQDPATIFRLMEPLVPGKFRKWTNNGGEASRQP